jgi:hypothetical protein
MRLALFAAAVTLAAAERFVAIDNVCAWPNLKLLPDGRIAAIIFNQPSHARTEGSVEAWLSADGGRLWTRAGTPAPHEPGTIRLNVAAGFAHDGALVVLAAGARVEQRTDRWLPVWASRSTDGGKTWTRSSNVAVPAETAGFLIPFGDIQQLPDGRLAASFYTDFRSSAFGGTPHGKPGRENHAYVLFSKDGGRSWGDAAVIGLRDYNETALLRVGAGRMLAVARTVQQARLEMFVSEDEGRTWRNEGAVSMPSQHPAHLARLRDGRILLTYGNREKSNGGVMARVSADQGRTWSAAWPVVRLDGSRDHGYPSSVQLADGTIVTAWYSSGIEAHQRYHMGVLRWTLDQP